MARPTDNYELVKAFDDEEQLHPALCERCSAARSDSRSVFRQLVILTVLCTVLICGTTYIVGTYLFPKPGHHPQKGYSTEWDLLRGTIETELVTYTSAFTYNATDGSYYRKFDPTEPQYVGNPSPEIDKAWDDLLYGQYLVISKGEAQHLENPVEYKGFYMAEPEVMHSLHCVNAVRKALNHEYYMIHDKHKLPEALYQVHVEHCLDQLRQNIQCAGDLTPVLLRPHGEEPHVNLVGTPQTHTCRNWKHFRKWYTERGDEFGHVNSGGT